MATAIPPMMIWLAVKPDISAWSGNLGSPLASWKNDWLSHTPIDALRAIQVGASSQTCEVRMSSQVAAEPDVLAGHCLGLAGRVLHAELVDEEGDAVERRVDEERGLAEELEELHAR